MKNKSGHKLCDTAKDLVCLNSYINIIDNRQVIIENCRQISECNDVLVKVLTGSFQVEIWGSGLSLNTFTTESVEICGTVETVSITSRRKREKQL